MDKAIHSYFNVKMNEQACASWQGEQQLGRHAQQRVILVASGDSFSPEVRKPSLRSTASSIAQEIGEGLLLSSLVCFYFIVYSFGA